MPELNKPAPELGIKRKSNSIAFVEGGLSAYKKIMTNLDSTKESKIPEKINREGAFDCSEDILNCIVSVPTEYPTFTEKKLLKADPFGQERKPTHSVPELNKGIGYGSFAVFEDQVNGKAQNSIEASNLILPNNQLPVFNTSCGAQLNLLRNMNYISDPLANAYGMTKSVSNSYENQSMPTDDSNGSFNGANFGVSNIFGSSQGKYILQ
ncbi:hypothetical protein AX774_g5844 [Zancudomyces culisetae]|uniref:Uncharacterized protein n=1 Tax=Zancudomyces culisetae TaxID=1213189 RepID=A0A1R1PID9_ZANCU|nr:hypothetical protein AX774_g5844 [Zancudomyces culisetae]|eukprot:OMH80716.1 hypothetical protein AX774_g5844 [Zancudomyces culisetae]